jgi:hypothetical protein
LALQPASANAATARMTWNRTVSITDRASLGAVCHERR